MGVAGGKAAPRLGAALGRRAAPHHEIAKMHAKLQELKAGAQQALAAGHFEKAAHLSKAAHETAMKIQAMHRHVAAPAGLEKRLAAVEARLDRIEKLLYRIAKQLED
jgi:hypothetical protein